MKSFKNKLVVVTGSASGIGEALAKHFAKEGAQLILIDNNKLELGRVANSLKENVKKTFCFDVGNYASFEKVAREVENDFSGADVLINNAGVALGAMSAEETSNEEFEWLMNVNFWGMVYGSKAFLPQLKAKNQAVLVNVSSLFGLIGIKYQSAYCSSKFAIRGYTESLMAENMDNGLQVHIVHPGGVNTNISNNARGGNQKFNKVFHDKFLLKNPPEKAAAVIVKGIKANRRRIKVNSEAHAGDYMARLFPVSMINFLQKHFHTDFD